MFVDDPIRVLKFMKKAHKAVLGMILLLLACGGCASILQKSDTRLIEWGPGGDLKQLTKAMQSPAERGEVVAPIPVASVSPSSGEGRPGADLKQLITLMQTPPEQRPAAIPIVEDTAASSPVVSSRDESVAAPGSPPANSAPAPATAMAPVRFAAPAGTVVQDSGLPSSRSASTGEAQTRGNGRPPSPRTETAALIPRTPEPISSESLRSPGERSSFEQSYRLGPEDVVSIAVWENRELTMDVTVRPDGKISLPLINDVQAADLTPVELAGAITERLRAYIKDPHVTVIVSQLVAPKIYVIGSVLRPGNYPLRQEMSVLQALSLAGGFTTFASPGNIKLLRRTGNGQEIRKINYYKLIDEGGEGNDKLKPGDTIVVP